MVMEEKNARVCERACAQAFLLTHVTSSCVASMLEWVEFDIPELFGNLDIVGTFVLSWIPSTSSLFLL